MKPKAGATRRARHTCTHKQTNITTLTPVRTDHDNNTKSVLLFVVAIVIDVISIVIIVILVAITAIAGHKNKHIKYVNVDAIKHKRTKQTA